MFQLFEEVVVQLIWEGVVYQLFWQEVLFWEEEEVVEVVVVF
jgi:hypothetical protein